MLRKQGGVFNLQLTLILVAILGVWTSGAYFTGYFRGKEVQVKKYEDKISKLNTLLTKQKQKSDKKLIEAENKKNEERGKTQAVINTGIKNGGWWNEKTPDEANTVVWGN